MTACHTEVLPGFVHSKSKLGTAVRGSIRVSDS